ncbi:MAG: DUF4383 domain-containing protein [Acidobacteriota bacterium]|nr:DUF4383 domain-containing protein [Acidobacteriota bacterium]
MIKTFALIFGIVYLLVGILGFVPGINNMDAAGLEPVSVHMSHGRLLGLFPVNAMHNIVHILIGVWGILASRSIGGARVYAQGLAIIYGLLTILGLIPATDTLFGLAPIYGHDVWLHAGTALIAAYFGFVARNSDGLPADAR